MGLCQNIESNIGHYYSNIDSECPAIDDQWKDIENNKSVSGKITRKITKISLGSEALKSPSAGIKFYGLERRRKSRCCQPSIDKSFGRKLFGKQHHIVQILPSTTLLLKFGTKKLKIHSNVPTLQNLLLTTKRSSRAEKAE